MNHHYRIRLWLAAMLLLSSALTVSAQAAKKGLLWKISGRNIRQATYLYGTLHLFDTSQYLLPAPVFARLKLVHQVYFELDFGKINTAEMMHSLWITDSTKFLNKALDTGSLRKLKNLVSASPVLKALGPKIFQLKPFYVAAFLMAGEHSISLDLELYKAALARDIPVGGIETMAEQLNAIDAIPVSAQAKMLIDMLKTYRSSTDLITEMTGIYVKQDLESLLEDLNKEMPMDASFNTVLVNNRNLVMAGRIEKLAGQRSMLIAVGAGHLGGKKGLIDLLRAKGYTLTPVYFQFRKHLL